MLGLESGRARDRQFTLSSNQCRQVADALGKRPQPSLLGVLEGDDVSQPERHGGAALRFRRDRPADPADLTLPEMRHRLEMHPDVSERLREWKHLYKRLGIVLQHLAAHGRSTVVKGCRDANRGWRRSPLGGNNGMQYYLWWAPNGSPAARTLDLPGHAILVRDVRHHDDHSPLSAGAVGDYLHLTTSDELIEDIAGSPWTDEQIDFVDDDSPVRLILGRPGSGKTTVLWKAVEARSNERALYLTWSRALTQHAEERFASFAPVDVEVIARDFTTFLGEVCGADVTRQPLGASRAQFDEVLTRLGRDAGPWARRPHALHAELRGIFFGRAVPGDDECATDHGIARLNDEAYAALRDDYGGVGERAAKSLLRVAQPFVRDRARVREVFPELVAATQAIERLRRDEVPEGFERFDRVVVDEVQDLTLLETAVVVELCRAIARARGRAPWLLMAGDSGQTVRPTGFEWGPLNDLLVRRVRRPEEFHLEDHLRCPSRIAEVIERASQRYTAVEKEVRPTRQRRQRGGTACRRAARPRASLRTLRGGPAARAPRRGGRRGRRFTAERPSRLGAGGVAGHGAQPGGRQGAGVPVGLRARSGPSTLHLGAGEHAVRDRRGPRAAGAPDVDRPPAGDAESGDGDAGVRGRRGRRRRPEREPGVARGCRAVQRGRSARPSGSFRCVG